MNNLRILKVRKGFQRFDLKKIELWRWEGRGQDHINLLRLEAIGHLSPGVRFWPHCVGWQGRLGWSEWR